MRALLFPRIVWTFSPFLTSLPFFVKAGEMTSFFRYSAIFARGDNSEALAQILPGNRKLDAP